MFFKATMGSMFEGADPMRKRVAVAGCWFAILAALSVCEAAEKADLRGTSATIAIPLSGSKTTLRFIVKNKGKAPFLISAPFFNAGAKMSLRVIFPDGTKKEISRLSRMPIRPLAPGKAKSWDIDLTKWIELKQQGRYQIRFYVNGVTSNTVILVKDPSNTNKTSGCQK